MFKIGDFSKLSQVPIKTLRYYDRIGLFEPAEVEPFTKYRYYTLDQVPRLNRILALKDLGFSLDQIRELLEEDLSAEELRGMLKMKHAEVQNLIAEEQQRLGRIEARLRQIEQENLMPETYEIVVKKVEPFKAAVLRDVIANYASVGPLYAELIDTMEKAGLKPSGASAALFYDEEYKESDVDVEVFFPVDDDVALEGRAEVRTIQGVEQMASLMRIGPYDDFTPQYQALMQWISDNGYAICGPNREWYLRTQADGVAPDEYVTELQFPVRKV